MKFANPNYRSPTAALSRNRVKDKKALTDAIAGALSSSTLAATTPQEREQIAARIAQRPGGAAARYAGSDLAGELASLETTPLVANPAATYGSSGSAGAAQQSGVAIDELA